jgi:hypothetical protein
MDGFMKLQSKIKSDARNKQIDDLSSIAAPSVATPDKGTDDGAV